MAAKKKRDYPLGPDGKRLPSVTEIIGKNLGWSKDPLMGWAWKMGKAGEPLYASRDAAGKVGTAVHDIVSEKLGGESAIMDASLRERSEPNADRVVECLRQRGWTVVKTELAMGGLETGFCGTLDLVVRDVQGNVGVVDIKTGFVGEEVVLQLAAYAALYETVRGAAPAIVWGGVIQCRPGDPLVVTTYSADQLIAAGKIFAALCTVHKVRPQLKVRP